MNILNDKQVPVTRACLINIKFVIQSLLTQRLTVAHGREKKNQNNKVLSKQIHHVSLCHEIAEQTHKISKVHTEVNGLPHVQILCKD